MAARELFKPISIDKKLGEIYFDEKCLLNGYEAAPKTNPFTDAAAEAALKKYQDPKKAIKIKLMGLSDTLRFDKSSKFSKKLPYSKVKYSEVKFHKVFNHSKTNLVLGVQGPDKLNQYLIIGFQQPIKASHLDSQLDYADLAPKNNLKNKIPLSDVSSHRDPSPVYNNVTPPIVNTETSRRMSQDSFTGLNGRNQEIAEIQEIGQPKTRYEMVEISADVNSPIMERNSIHSSTSSFFQKPMTPQSITHTITSRSSNHSHSETIRDLTNQRQEYSPLCSKCRSKCESLVSTATSPLALPKESSAVGKFPTTNSISSSSSTKPQSKSLNTVSRSNTVSFSRRSRDKYHNRRSDSMTSTSSRHTVTTDASSHYVLDEERELFEHHHRGSAHMNGGEERPYPANADTVVVRANSPMYRTNPRTRSHSGSRQTKHKKKKSKHGHRARSMVATNNVPVQEYRSSQQYATNQSHMPIQKRTITTTSSSNRNFDKPLFILASGRFKPFSEFSHEHDPEQHGICSICGEEGVGDPRQVEIIRTDIAKGPVISDEGCVYMYSATKPVDYTNRNGTLRRSNKSSRRARLSVSSLESNHERPVQPDLAPIYRSAVPVQEEQITQSHAKKKGSFPYADERIKSYQTSNENSISSKTRKDPRILVGAVPVYRNTSPSDPNIADVIIPIELSRQRNKNRRYSHSHSHSRHSSMSEGENIVRPVGSVSYEEIQLSSDHYASHDSGSRRSSGKKKIYRIESSDSDSSTVSDISNPRLTGSIKVKPLHY
ncbi:unnamed protein product [Rodentolepis nana]|uniref:Doublecortin domain-containing protein n=1 Tax=Rodentolepis nana TaxID=102285 RepID=A0A0R3T2R2_RODNA|nr:unnamed protein product [Rodentolepis nana]